MKRLTLSVLAFVALLVGSVGLHAAPAAAEPICINIPPVPPVLTGPLEICIPL